MILASAYAHELPRYGLEVGLTNYAAGSHLIFNFVYDICLHFTISHASNLGFF